jgi:hypothetical protein
MHLPDREHAKAVVTQKSHIELATVDVLFNDSVGPYALVNEPDTSSKLLVVLNDGSL